MPSEKSSTPSSVPANEPDRLKALHRYEVLDTPPEIAFDRITTLAARLFDVPIALVSLVDRSRAWFKSCYGFGSREVERDATICSFAILVNDILVIPDARQDQRLVCNPFVQSEPGVRFYAGAPLITPDGYNLGTLCLLDTKPRSDLSADQRATLIDLAAMVMDELELRLAVHRVEAANRIKDEFLTVLSHELRSPLNPILGWTKMLRSGKVDQTRAVQALEIIEHNAQLQAQLIGDLLDVSQILRGNFNLNVVEVTLQSTIEDAIATIKLAAEAKEIKLQIEMPSAPVIVVGDAVRLQQVMWNLLSNAVKFTPNKGQITVRLIQLDSSAQVQIVDTGKGITREFLPHVFSHFQQEDGSTTRKFGGLGLGLAIVRQIVELHGGTVNANSSGQEQGATFTLQLPLFNSSKIPNPQSTLAVSPSPSNIRPPSTSPLTGLHILVVDDEPDSRDIAAFILQQAGADVTTVSSASKALQVLQTTKIDLLLSDVGMPEMDGYELMNEIHQLLSQPDAASTQAKPVSLPAIALTAYAEEVDQQQAFACGFRVHLVKPVEPKQLVQAIATIIGRGQPV